MRVAFAFVLFVVLSGSALAAQAGGVHRLRAAEEAFYAAGQPFQTDWTPRPVNPYLVPRQNLDAPSPFVALMPTTLRHHLIGWAGGHNPRTFRTWEVWIFAQTSSAVFFAQLVGQHCKPPNCNASVRRVDNVVFDGSLSADVSRALAQLRHR